MTLNAKITKAFIGGAVAAEFLRQMEPDVMAAYPITPQTPIIESFAKMKADGLVDTEIIPVESEHSAMSAAVGAAAAGARSVTATSSQGLALMHEVLYAASGMRLPILMFVSSRALSAPLNIHGEHGDVMGARDAGWIQLFSENVQEVYHNGFIALRLAEKTGLPAMVVMDGFSTSHTTERVEIFSDEAARKFIGEYRPEKHLLDFDDPVSFGAVALQDSYFEFKIQQHEAFRSALREYENVCADFNETFGTDYGYFESYKLEDAERAIVIMGSTAGTAKEVVDRLRKKNEKVGLLKIKLFRPFPHEKISEALSGVKKIAVLDRAISLGTKSPIYSEIVNSLYKTQDTRCKIQSYVYGLGGRDTYEKDIERVFDELARKKSDDKIRFVC